MKALWRELEEMTPEQRGDTLLTGEVAAGIPVDGCTMWICEHSPLYLKARRSFHHSAEWKRFRREFLEEHPVCVRCGAPATVVHHINAYTIDKTLIAWGFSWIFEHPECCAPLCHECHYEEHKGLIASEAFREPRKAGFLRRWKERWRAYRARHYMK
jgi:hypothetical protein